MPQKNIDQTDHISEVSMVTSDALQASLSSQLTPVPSPKLSGGLDSTGMGSVGGTLTTTLVQCAVSVVPPAKTKKVFIPAVKPSKFLKAMLHDPVYSSAYDKCMDHVGGWPLARLRAVYRNEYNSLRSRRQQAKARHISFNDRLKDLRDWLIHLGPRPEAGWTVHRINNYKGYEPGNIKWATRQEQTEIRKVTKWHDVNGKHMTTKQLAKHLDLTYTCVYKRLQNGWTVERMLDERQKNGGVATWQFPFMLVHLLEPQYHKRKSYQQSRIDWFIARMKKQLDAIDSGEIQNISDPDRDLLQLELDRALHDLNDMIKKRKEEAENDARMMIASLKAFKVFPDPHPLQEPVFKDQPESVNVPAVHTACNAATHDPAGCDDYKDFMQNWKEQQDCKRANVSYLANIIAADAPGDPFSTPYSDPVLPHLIPDDIYRTYACRAYGIIAECKGKEAAATLLVEYQARGIPFAGENLGELQFGAEL